MNWLLIPTKPLHVLPELAQRIGLDEAIALQQIHYRVRGHEEYATTDTTVWDRYFHQGRWWVSLTEREWQAQDFPFWSYPTIRRIFASLEEMTLILTDTFSKGRGNRRKWHTVDYEALSVLDRFTIEGCGMRRDKRVVAIANLIRSERSDQIDHISLRTDQIDHISPEIRSKRSDQIDHISPKTAILRTDQFDHISKISNFSRLLLIFLNIYIYLDLDLLERDLERRSTSHTTFSSFFASFFLLLATRENGWVDCTASADALDGCDFWEVYEDNWPGEPEKLLINRTGESDALIDNPEAKPEKAGEEQPYPKKSSERKNKSSKNSSASKTSQKSRAAQGNTSSGKASKSADKPASQPTTKPAAQPTTPKYKYLKVFGDDEAMKRDFLALWKEHPKHEGAEEASREYYRQRKLGVSAEQITREHQEALERVWVGREVQYVTRLHRWLADRLLNRDLDIAVVEEVKLPYPDEYQQVRDQYFAVCAQQDVPFGNEKEAQLIWSAQVADPENLAGILEATPFFLEKKRNLEGEQICRFERYLQHRWQVVLSHKRGKALVQDGTISDRTLKVFNGWFRPAVEAGIVQFSSASPEVTGLPIGVIGVRGRETQDQWRGWEAIAQEFPLERLRDLALEQRDPELWAELRYYQGLYDEQGEPVLAGWSRYENNTVAILDGHLVLVGREDS